MIDPTTGKAVAQLPPGVGAQIEPSWSLNGQHLVYSQNGQLVMVEPGVKGSVPAILTRPPAGTSDRNPAFAPTNKAIVVAYVQRIGNAAHQLCFVSSDQVLAAQHVHHGAGMGSGKPDQLVSGRQDHPGVRQPRTTVTTSAC